MAGIYIHIPFCKQSCSYCDFHFSTSLKHKTRFNSRDCLKKLKTEKTVNYPGKNKHDIFWGRNTFYYWVRMI